MSGGPEDPSQDSLDDVAGLERTWADRLAWIDAALANPDAAAPRTPGHRMTITFEGGPADGDELHGLAARVVGDWVPPYVCAKIDGRHEHYVRVAEGRYQHAGACRQLAEGGRHPDCGHDHETQW